MKKRLLAMLLAVTMIASMIVLPSEAATPEVGPTTSATCPHCGAAWDSIDWKELGYSAEAALEGTGVLSGHYYLADDQKVNSPYTFGESEGQTEDKAVDVCIDLQGFTLEAAKGNTRALYVYNYSRLSILDTVGGGQVIGTGYSDTKGKSGGTIYQAANSRVDLYSGKLVNAQTAREGNGGVVYVGTGAQFNMTGGEIDASKVAGASGVTTSGGAIYCYAGEVNISGGLIRGGSATNGGSIHVGGKAEATISGGVVMGGYAASRGGNINNNGKLTISGGTITGGMTDLSGDYRGGNICSFNNDSTATVEITGGLIEEGHSGTYDTNVTLWSGQATISGGTIRGGLMNNLAVTTITGNPEIANHGYEGVVAYVKEKIVIDGLTDGAKIIIRFSNENSTFGVLTNATTSPNVAAYLEAGYLLPASRHSLSVNADGALGSTLDNNGYCPHCQKEVSWGKYAATTVNSGHYFVGGSGLTLNAGDAALTVASGKDIVLDLNRGMTINAPYSVAGKLTFLGTSSSIAQLKCTATDTVNGGVATVTGTLNIYDGVITGTTVSGNGGAIYVNNGKLNMYGGMIQGGSATNGGNVYLYGNNSQFNLEGGYVIDGTATSSSGNIQVEGGILTVNGGVIADGYASSSNSNSGNIQVHTGGEVVINDGIIIGGEAKNRGGNISCPATNGVLTINGGLIADGTANYGGNIYIGHGKLNMYGGTVANGTGKQYGGNIALYGVFYSAHTTCLSTIGDNDTTDTEVAPLVSGGDSPLGANVYVDGIATFGACTITGSTEAAVPAFYLGDNARLTLEETFDNELIVEVGDGRITELDQNRCLANTTCEGLQAKLFVHNYDMAQLVENEAHQLALAGAALVSETTGKLTWYLDAQSAYNDYAAGTYLKLYTPQTLAISGDIVLDLNGNNATISGSGTVYGFDSANEDYDGYGIATVTDPEVTLLSDYQRPDGKQYITVTGTEGSSFHRLGISISNVSLRPSISGIYYQGIWQCDSVLQDKIKTFGVAVSVKDMPGIDFADDKDTLYTQFNKADFANGQAKTSVMIADIIKEGAENDQRGSMSIFAAPYMVLDNGTEAGMTIVTEDRKPAAGGVSYSLKDVVGTVNRIWPKLTEVQKAGVRTFYAIDETVMDGWGLYNIKADIEGTAAVRPLKILTLGHSLSVDSGHMLNRVAAAEGYNQEFIIGILYYSGCRLDQHVNFIKGNSPEYALYISSNLTPDEPPVRMADYTMYDAIKYDDWDIIIMQGGVYEPTKSTYYTNGNIQFIQNYVNQHKTNPDAIFAWHNAWAPPTDADLMAQYLHTPHVYQQWYAVFNNDRAAWYNAMQKCVTDHILTDSSFIYYIPGGTAIENALSSYLGEKDLHRDYVHVTDLGRVIAAYTWYCTLAGIDHLDEIKLNTIPVAFFKSTTGTEDRVLTKAEKDIILESVNNALANPFEVTQSQYTVAPTE